jgi:hypothetical protein
MLITIFLVLGVVGCGVAIVALLETSRNAREIKKLKQR